MSTLSPLDDPVRPERDVAGLTDWLRRHQRIFVLTGAGCSTGSGIPDYRGADGAWKRPPPVTYQAFVGEAETRGRYWARSFVGWPHFNSAQPNASHTALASLETAGKLSLLVTQNVDGLHQRAGSTQVVDLHGRLDEAVCLGCRARVPRDTLQLQLARENPGWEGLHAAAAPDGDADLDGLDFSRFVAPRCGRCDGLLKPDVVFFGENVPRERVAAAHEALARSDAMLVVGSSLMVYSGYRFARAARETGLPLAIVTRGVTRADALATLKVELDCATALPTALAA